MHSGVAVEPFDVPVLAVRVDAHLMDCLKALRTKRPSTAAAAAANRSSSSAAFRSRRLASSVARDARRSSAVSFLG